MIKKITKNGKLNSLLFIIFLVAILSMFLTSVHAAPIGPTAEVLGNTTKNATAATKINSTVNGTGLVDISPGGYIFTTRLTSVQQNTRWKAYVGNVTGTLVLDDAYNNRIFAWTLSSVAGEVYATRASGDINWSGINCTWIADGRDNKTDDMINRSLSNRTPEHNEEIVLSHTSASSKDDNVTATFNLRNHSSITVGSVVIGKDECFTVQTYQNSAEQTFDDSDNANFTQIILYDAAYNITNGNVVYAAPIEDEVTGYRSDSTYDFQMIVPEDGTVGFSGSTAYYFYVELT